MLFRSVSQSRYEFNVVVISLSVYVASVYLTYNVMYNLFYKYVRAIDATSLSVSRKKRYSDILDVFESFKKSISLYSKIPLLNVFVMLLCISKEKEMRGMFDLIDKGC